MEPFRQSLTRVLPSGFALAAGGVPSVWKTVSVVFDDLDCVCMTYGHLIATGAMGAQLPLALVVRFGLFVAGFCRGGRCTELTETVLVTPESMLNPMEDGDE